MPLSFRDALRHRFFAQRNGRDYSSPHSHHAVIAAILREQPNDSETEIKHAGTSQRVEATELLLIERAVRCGDPWSGHIALPGGHREAEDADLIATAQRETAEEVGLALARHGEPLGRLETVPLGNHLRGRPRLDVVPLVFWWQAAGARLWLDSSEVKAAFWVSLAELHDPAAQTSHLVHGPNGPCRLPATSVRGRLLWGLTYGVVRQVIGEASVS